MRSILFMLFISTSLQAAIIEKAWTKVSFKATGSPGFLTIDGTGAKFTGNYRIQGEGIFGTFICELKNLKTGLALRDRHMKGKYLEVGKYPRAVLKVNKLITKPGGVEFVGDLTLKGKTRMVTGQGTLTHDKKTITKLDLNFQINLKEYGFEIPEYLGVTVARVVDLRVQYK